jgi:hypothetical protein
MVTNETPPHRQGEPPRQLRDLIDVLRQNLARADAMVCATEHQLERITWSDGGGKDEHNDGEGDAKGRSLAIL